MKYLQKAWVRIIIAFLLGGVLREAIFISTGNPNRPRGAYYDIITLVCVVGLYFVLTYYARSRKTNTIN